MLNKVLKHVFYVNNATVNNFAGIMHVVLPRTYNNNLDNSARCLKDFPPVPPRSGTPTIYYTSGHWASNDVTNKPSQYASKKC